jgi:hypothetical protein
MSKIDLGRSFGDEVNAVPLRLNDKNYPELHIPDSEDERLLDLPDEGVCEIRYKIVRRHHREETNGDTKKKRRTCSITMEIRSLDPPAKANGKKKTHWEMFNGGK